MGHTRHRRKPNNTQHGMKHPETHDNMGYIRYRRNANKKQHGMEHPESLTTWDTQDTGGMQIKNSTECTIQRH
jgi:hypothetical protein